MFYRWRYQDAGSRDVSGPDVEFADQDEAEDWLGQAWPGLLDGGVDQVTLLCEGAEVYGPMKLHPAD